MEQDQKDFFLGNDIAELTNVVKLMKAKRVTVGQLATPKAEDRLNLNLPL